MRWLIKSLLISLICLFVTWLGVLLFLAAQNHFAPMSFDNLAATAPIGDGRTWAAVYQDSSVPLVASTVEFHLLDSNGHSLQTFSIPRKRGGNIVQISYMTTDSDGNLYYILHYVDAVSGVYAQIQELEVYRPGFNPFTRRRSIRLDWGTQLEGETAAGDNKDTVEYVHVRVAEDYAVLTGAGDCNPSPDEEDYRLVRKTYSLEHFLQSGDPFIKKRVDFSVSKEEPVYKAVPVDDPAYADNDGVVYIAKTGRVFEAWSTPDGSFVRPLDLGGTEGSFLYASFVDMYTDQEGYSHALIGVHPEGQIVDMDLLRETSSIPFRSIDSLSNGYQYSDVLDLRLSSENDFTGYAAMVQNRENQRTELSLSYNNVKSHLIHIDMLLGSLVKKSWIYKWICIFPAGVWLLLAGWRHVFVKRKTLRSKVLWVAVPLVVIALLIIGTASYVIYKNSLTETYKAKAESQGYLLSVVFDRAELGKLNTPSEYGGPVYNYLSQEMRSLDVYTSSASYEAATETLFTGVDHKWPSQYPFGIRRNASLQRLYLAAVSGEPESGTVSDLFGKREICVTPLSSSSSNTLFLLETGVFQAQIDQEANLFLWRLVWFGIAVLLILTFLLRASLNGVLKPVEKVRVYAAKLNEAFSSDEKKIPETAKDLAEVKWVIDEDDKTGKLSKDELSDISSSLTGVKETISKVLSEWNAKRMEIFRYVPETFSGLKNDESGAAAERFCFVLAADMLPGDGVRSVQALADLTKEFLSWVWTNGEKKNALVLADGANAQSARLIWPVGEGINTAELCRDILTTVKGLLGGVDSYNKNRAASDCEMLVSCFLHYVPVTFNDIETVDKDKERNKASQPQDSAVMHTKELITGEIIPKENKSSDAVDYLSGILSVNKVNRRNFPTMTSPSLDDRLEQCAVFRGLASRLVVTDEAYTLLAGREYNFNVDPKGFYQEDENRFIGYPGGADRGKGLHDFYGVSNDGLKQLLTETRSAFFDALSLYESAGNKVKYNELPVSIAKAYYEAYVSFVQVAAVFDNVINKDRIAKYYRDEAYANYEKYYFQTDADKG